MANIPVVPLTSSIEIPEQRKIFYTNDFSISNIEGNNYLLFPFYNGRNVELQDFSFFIVHMAYKEYYNVIWLCKKDPNINDTICVIKQTGTAYTHNNERITPTINKYILSSLNTTELIYAVGILK